MSNIAIVPAREGSKGVPGKNKRLLAGIPLVSHSIEFGLNSGIIEQVVINTDDQEIIDYCASRYATVETYKRSKELSQDDVSMAKVLIDYIEKTNCSADFIILLQPTSPIRDHKDLEKMMKIIESDPTIDCVTSVSKVPQHWSPHLMFELVSGRMVPFKTLIPTRRQDVQDSFIRNGQIYVFRISALIQERKIITDNTYGMVSSLKGVNIDSEEDWAHAVSLFESI